MVDYGEQPDRAAVKVTPDAIDPTFSQVEFNDGTTETMPSDQAQALPFEAPAVAGDMPAAPYDPAAYGPPAAPPMSPTELAGTGDPGYSVAQPAPMDESTLVAAARGTSLPSSSAPGTDGLVPVGVKVGNGTAQPDMGEIVAPAQPGGFAPFGETATSGAQTTERAEDPAAAAARTDAAFDADAAGRRAADQTTYEAKQNELLTTAAGNENRIAEQEHQIALAQAEQRQQARVIKAMEDHPIDPDEFWNSSPARTAGAWIGLALSGFLQGATRGQNPALNQMVQALNHAQDRWLANQQRNREGVLRRREQAMGDAKTAEASLRMQLSGLMERRIMLDAQRQGLPPPPALETYIAQGAVKRAEAQTQIGQQTTRVATESVSRESRATPGTGPVTRFDAELRGIGMDPKKHQEATTAGVPDKARAASELRTIHQALAKIAAENGGQLPAQGTLSLSKLGLAPFAARWGFAEDQVTTTQLLNQASLAYMSAIGNIKGMDSNVEREKFDQILNSGEGASTLRAIDERARFAENAAVSLASGFAGGNARRYLDLLAAQQVAPSKPGDFPERVVQPGAGPTEAQTLDQAGGGGPAPGPLASRPAAKVLDATTPGSRPGTYQRLRGSKPAVRP